MVNLLCLCGGAEDDVIEMSPPEEAQTTGEEDDSHLDEGVGSDPGDGSLYEHFRERWTHFGDRTAMVDHISGRSLTYSELLETVMRLAGAFSSIGISARQRVAVHADNSLQSVLALLAIEFLNATVVACKTSLTVREMVYQCSLVDVEFIISDVSCHTVALQSLEQLPLVKKVIVANMESPANDLRIAATMDDLLNRGTCFEVPDNVQPFEDEVLITFTSGTTGLPKGVMHTHAGLVGQFRVAGPSGGNLLHSNDVSLQWGPVSHISGNLCIHIGLDVGAVNVIGDVRRDLKDVLRLCDEYQVTHLVAMPVVLRRMIDILKAAEDIAIGSGRNRCKSLKTVLVGGSIVSVPWSEELISLLDLETYRIVFGMSESQLVTATPDKEKWLTSIGTPMPGVEIKIVDADGNTLGPNERGEMAIRSPTVMKGYDKQPDATAEVLVDGWLLSGDCAYMDERGVVFILERLKEMIKCMDNQLAPAELEDYLVGNHSDVKEVAVIGLPDEELGEAPTAFAVLEDGVEPSDDLRQQLANMIKDEFASYKQLYGGVFFVTEIPKTDSGKFAKTELKRKAIAGEVETF